MDIVSVIKSLIPYKLVLLRRRFLVSWHCLLKKNMKRRDQLPILHFHLVDHCNLNCIGCDNFSPLAPPVFASVDVFEADCRRMNELMANRNGIGEIQLLGGEPLLHPDAATFIRIARKYFDTPTIRLITNGLLLDKQTNAFYKACIECNVNIVVTKYPVKSVDYGRIARFVQGKGVNFSFYGNTGAVEKTMMCIPLDINGRQDGRDSFLRCTRANRCIALDNGRLYPCSLIPYVKYFNKRFVKDLQVSGSDFVDIYKASSFDELLDFVCRPVPFCRYCNIRGKVDGIKFGISKKQISEWTGSN